jgi:hypothetical protein
MAFLILSSFTVFTDQQVYVLVVVVFYVDTCPLQLLISGLTSVSLLESKWGASCEHPKTAIFMSIIYGDI